MSDTPIEPTNNGIETPPATPLALVETEAPVADTAPVVTVTPYKIMAVFVAQKRVDGVVVDELALTNTESNSGMFEAFGADQLSTLEARSAASAELQLNTPPAPEGPAADAAALLAPQ